MGPTRPLSPGRKPMIGRRNIIKSIVLCGASILAVAATATTSQAADKTLKIGFVGVTSGPAAAWGTSNVRSMQTLAAWRKEKGKKMGDHPKKIGVLTFDNKKAPKRATAGMEKMAQEGIHY